MNNNKKDEILEKASKMSSGFEIRQPIRPELKPEPGEKIISGETNAAIILGSATSNITERKIDSSAITLATGIGTAIKGNQVPPDKNVKLSPNFYYDSAVISICEQTNPDLYWGSKLKNIPQSAENNTANSSAIVLKADELRLFSRGSVKIVTRVDQQESDLILPHNSSKPPPAHPRRDPQGIWLIANDEHETTQPMVKGQNLSEFLGKLVDEINSLYSLIYKIVEQQSRVNEAVRDHTHLSDFSIQPLIRGLDPATIQVVEDVQYNLNDLCVIKPHTRYVPKLQILKRTYLNNIGNKAINSKYNRVN